MYEHLSNSYLIHVMSCSTCSPVWVDYKSYDGIMKPCLLGYGGCKDGWHNIQYWSVWRACKDREKILLDIFKLL